MAHLDRLVLHSVENLKGRHDLAGRKDLNLEPIVGDLGDAFREHLAAAIERVERFRPARGEPPFGIRHRLSDGRFCNGNGSGTDADRGQELTAL